MISAHIHEGFIAIWPWLIVSLALFCLLVAVAFIDVGIYEINISQLSFGDYLLFFFAGIKTHVFFAGDGFEFPTAWTAMFLLGAYLSLGFPLHGLYGFGIQEMAFSRSRGLWWYSMSIWVASTVIAYFAIAVAVALAATLAFGGNVSMGISSFMPTVLNFREADLAQPPYDIAPYLIGFVLALIAICMTQLMLSLLVSPVLSFGVTVAIGFLSAFFTSSLLPGNYLMAARGSAFMLNGVDTVFGIVASVLVSLVMCVVGALTLRRKDLLPREES